jgi:hypothetical protein
MSENNLVTEPTQVNVGGSTFEAFAPEGFAQVVPDAPSDLSALEGADVVVATTANISVSTDPLPHEQLLQNRPTVSGADSLTLDDAAEYNRLLGRANAAPNNEQAKQELNAFKQLHALP